MKCHKNITAVNGQSQYTRKRDYDPPHILLTKTNQLEFDSRIRDRRHARVNARDQV